MLSYEDKFEKGTRSLEELLKPEHTAVLVIDLQNDFMEPEGYFAKAGGNTSMIKGIVPKVAHLVEEARRAAALVIWVRFTSMPGGASDSPAYPIRRLTKQLTKEEAIRKGGLAVQGTWGWQIVDELKPEAGDLFIDKLRASAFLGTMLDIVLRANEIKTVVVPGETTDGCVLFTAFDALQLGYFTVVPRDCVADFSQDKHQAGIGVLKRRVDMPSSDEIVGVWRAAAREVVRL